MDLPEEVEGELARGRAAAADGNDGKARVCARRAVGVAFRKSRYSSQGALAQSTTQILKAISGSDAFDSEVRGAAARLSAGVAESEGASVSKQPVEDALAIIDALLE